jgi:hypothetical protein
MTARPRFYGIHVLLLLLALLSCTRNSEASTSVIPPPTNPLSNPVVGYGVVNVSYTHVVDQPSANALSLGYLRQGAVVRIVERRSVIHPRSGAESWVMVDGNFRGWLQEAVVNIYENEAQAKTAAISMTK